MADHQPPPDVARHVSFEKCTQGRAPNIFYGLCLFFTYFQLSVPIYGNNTVSDKLVLHLTFDHRNEVAPNLNDASGENNHAIPATYGHAVSVQVTVGGDSKDGEGLACSPYNWAMVPGNGLDLTRTVKMECRVKPDQDMGERVHTYRGIVTKGICGATDVYGLRFKGHTGQLQFVVRSGNETFVAESLINWKANTWYHIAGEYDGKMMRLYQNDVLLAQIPHQGPIDTTPDPLLIGTGWGADYAFTGVIDSVRIWGESASAGHRRETGQRIQLYPHQDERSVSIRHPAFSDWPFGYIIPENMGSDQGGLYEHLEKSEIRWHGPDQRGVIGYRGENDQVVFLVEMIPGDDSVQVNQTVHNKTNATWEHAYSFHCFTTCNTPPFKDFGMQRTFVHVADRGLLTTRQLLGENTSLGLCRMVHPGFGRHGFIDDALGARPDVTTASQVADLPLMLITSEDDKWIVAVATHQAAFLFTNGGNSCIHTCPYFGQVKPGQEKTTVSRIYIIQGDVETLRARYRKDFVQ